MLQTTIVPDKAAASWQGNLLLNLHFYASYRSVLRKSVVKFSRWEELRLVSDVDMRHRERKGNLISTESFSIMSLSIFYAYRVQQHFIPICFTRISQEITRKYSNLKLNIPVKPLVFAIFCI